MVTVADVTALMPGQEAADSLPPTDGEPGGAEHRWMWLRVAGAVVMGLWCIGLVVYSTTIYHHDILGEDFATYNQAWTLIGQGHLNPYDTIYHFPFFKSDFELIVWPLALVHLVYPGSVALLWIQDLAVAGSGFVVFLWIVDYLERRAVPVVARRRRGVGGAGGGGRQSRGVPDSLLRLPHGAHLHRVRPAGRA